MKEYTNIEEDYPPAPGRYDVLIESGSLRESQASWDGNGWCDVSLKNNEWITSWRAL